MRARASVEFVVFAVLLLGAWACIAYACVACKPPKTAEEVAKEAAEKAIATKIGVDYGEDLDDCIARGKVSGSFAVYEACAKALDRKLCADRGVRCVEAPNAR